MTVNKTQYSCLNQAKSQKHIKGILKKKSVSPHLRKSTGSWHNMKGIKRDKSKRFLRKKSIRDLHNEISSLTSPNDKALLSKTPRTTLNTDIKFDLNENTSGYQSNVRKSKVV